MFSKIQINKSTGNYSQQIEQIKDKLNNADAVVIGAGAGLSTSAGFTYSGERFYKHFSDFAEKYGITDMYSGGFMVIPSGHGPGQSFPMSFLRRPRSLSRFE